MSADPLPLRLHRAVSLLSRVGGSEADEGQSAIGEIAARIVQLEEALARLLDGVPGAAEQAKRVLAGG